MGRKSIIYAFAVLCLFTILLISISSAVASEPSIWQQYGGELTKITQSQNPASYSNIDNTTSLVITDVNGMTYDTSFPTQPLVTDFLNGGFTRLIAIQNGNYLQFLDKNLNLFSEISTGALLGQMQIGDFNHDNLNNEIAGIYAINNTDIELRYYQYNVSSNALVLLNSTSYTRSFNITSRGVRCIGGVNSFCAFTYGSVTNVTMVKHFYNGTEITGNTNKVLGDEVPALQDINNDGQYEGMVYNSLDVIIWNLANGLILNNISRTLPYSIVNARIVKVDATPNYKIAIYEVYSNSIRISVRRSDGSQLWAITKSVIFSTSWGFGIFDYNNDGIDDLWVGIGDNGVSGIYIYDGTNGNLLFSSFPYLDLDDGITLFGKQSFIISRMSSSTTPAIVYPRWNGGMAVYNPSSPASLQFILNLSTIGIPSCVTADLNFDGQNDIICSKSGFTGVILTNATNTNSVLNSVAFSPSTAVQVGTNLNALISCSDAKGDAIRYSASCDTGLNFTESYSASVNCLYNSTGFYNMTLRCRDIYHNDYSSLSQIISVSQTGQTCNNNGVCETGESNINCPNDCFVTGVNYTSAQGGLSLPTKLVDTTGNTETGLLPEIYYGTLAFFSNTLHPMIILIFLIIFVFIILGIGLVVKKIANKIKEM